MITEEDLRRHYAAFEVPAGSEQRVVSAVLQAHEPRRRSALIGAVLASAAVVAAAIVLVAIRSPHSSPVPMQPPVPTRPAAAVVPAPEPDVINGAVLLAGRPDAGARVLVEASPNSAITERLKKGQTVPTLNFPQVMTDAHGSWAVRIPARAFTSEYLEGRSVAIEVAVFDKDGRSTAWNFSMTEPARGHVAAGHQLVFDLARATVVLDGKRSRIPVAGPYVEAHGTLELVGGPPNSAPSGIPGVVYAYRSNAPSGRPIWTGKADAHGHFTASLNPGNYYFAGKSPRYENGAALCRAGGVVHFRTGTSVLVAVDCQAK